MKKQELTEVPDKLKAIGKAIRENYPDNYDADDVLSAFSSLTKALCKHGYGPEIVEIAMEVYDTPHILDQQLR